MAAAVFDVQPVLGPLKYNLTSLAVLRDQLFVGSSDGALTVYRSDSGEPDGAFTVTSSIPKFAKSRSALLQLVAVPQWNALFSRNGASRVVGPCCLFACASLRRCCL
jgi:hypothetical protein